MQPAGPTSFPRENLSRKREHRRSLSSRWKPKDRSRGIPDRLVRDVTPIAPLPLLPATLDDPPALCPELHQKEPVSLERQENRGAFNVFAKRDDRGPEFVAGPQGAEERYPRAKSGGMKVDLKLFLNDGKFHGQIVRS